MGLAAPAAEGGAWEEEVTAALVAGFSEAEEVEAIPAWMEGDAETAADSMVASYLSRQQRNERTTMDGVEDCCQRAR